MQITLKISSNLLLLHQHLVFLKFLIISLKNHPMRKCSNTIKNIQEFYIKYTSIINVKYFQRNTIKVFKRFFFCDARQNLIYLIIFKYLTDNKRIPLFFQKQNSNVNMKIYIFLLLSINPCKLIDNSKICGLCSFRCG